MKLKLDRLKEHYWEEVNEEVKFIGENGQTKVEEISGKDFNQFESMCDLYSDQLKIHWETKINWKLMNV